MRNKNKKTAKKCIFLLWPITITSSIAIGQVFNHNNIKQEINKILSIENNVNNSENNYLKKVSIVNVPDAQTMESDKKWIDSIKESANSGAVKLFFTRNASLVYQQSMLAIQYFLNSINFNANSNNYEDIVFCVDEDVYNQDKFNLSSLENNSEIFVIKNLQDIKNKLNQQNNDSTNQLYNSSYSVVPSYEILESLYNYYCTKMGQENMKFDLWIPDISLSRLWSGNDFFYKFLPFINKIYLLSDGNAQTYSFANAYVSRQKSTNFDDELILENLTKLINSSLSDEERKTIYKSTNLYDFLRTDFFSIFHIERYVDSSFYEIGKDKMYTSYVLNYDYLDMSEKLFESNETDKKTNYISGYEDFFKIKDNTLESFVYDGYEHYDPNKKNIIWIGDSLIREQKHVDSKRKEEIQKLFLALTKKYNPNEYNYFFKHHPYYSSEHQQQMTNFICGLAKDVKPIYFKNFPWELFLSWDKAHSSSKSHTPFFSLTSNNDNIPKTQLIGIQYTTTVILSTYSFITKQYNMSYSDAWKSINYENFPVPGTFDIIQRGLPSTLEYEKQVEINKQKTNDIYKPFLELGKFPYYESSQNSVDNFVIENGLTMTFTKQNNQNKNNLTTIIALSSSIGSLFVIAIVTVIVIYFKKIKKNKK